MKSEYEDLSFDELDELIQKATTDIPTLEPARAAKARKVRAEWMDLAETHVGREDFAEYREGVRRQDLILEGEYLYRQFTALEGTSNAKQTAELKKLLIAYREKIEDEEAWSHEIAEEIESMIEDLDS